MEKGIVFCGICPIDSSGKKVTVTDKEKEDFVKMLQDSDPSGRNYIYAEESFIKPLVALEILNKKTEK
jgi:hypothetical protein